MKKIRCFLAVDIVDEMAAAVRPVVAELAISTDSVKWVEPEGLHLTLKFFGEIEELETYEVAKTVTQAIQELPVFEIRVAGIGAFPAIDRPRTIWAGVTTGGDALIDLQSRVDAALKRLGYPRERRQFHPHLTIGRVRGKARQDELVAALKNVADYECGNALVDRVILFRSELFRTGPEYTVLATCPMQG